MKLVPKSSLRKQSRRPGMVERKRRAGRRRPRTDQNAEFGDLPAATRAAIKAFERSDQMLDAALAYAKHGIPVFPCDVKTKVPIARKLEDDAGNPIAGTGGFYRATTDPAQIIEWWGISAWPGYSHPYLIGMPTGDTLWVLDVDTGDEHAVDGIPVWERLQAEHGTVVTREHLTSSDGLHLIFEWSEENPVGLSTGHLPDGMETKGKGGYIIMPPSQRNGKAYRVSRDCKPAPAPAWLYDLIRHPAGKAGAASSSRPSGGTAWDDFTEIVSPELLADALKYVPNTFKWVEWNNFILAIFRSTGGSKRGFEVACAWSKTCPKFTEAHTEAYMPGRWEVIRGSPPSRTGASKIFNAAIKNGWKAKATYSTPKFDGLAAARVKLEQVIRRFLGIGLNVYQAFGRAYREIVEAVKVTTGVGKTSKAAAVIAWLITQSTGKRIGLAVPTHKLGKEIAQRFIDLGVDARVFYGRNAADPESPGDAMCLDLPKVEVATLAMQNIAKSCCKHGKEECPFYSAQAGRQCGYWRQQNGNKPQVWIFPRDLLFHDQRALGTFDFLFIDESLWDKQLRGIDSPWELPIESLLQPTSLPVTAARKMLGEMLNMQTEDGGLQQKIVVIDTDAKEQTEEIRKEWKHLPKLGLRPNMSKAQYSSLNKNLIGEITFARKIITVREELRRMLQDPSIDVSGRLVLEHSSKLQQRVLTWRGVAPIAERFRVPTMLIDATLPALDVLRISHPKAKIVADIEVAMPDCVHIQQVLDAPTSSAKLGKGNSTKHRQEMQRYILQRWFEIGRQKMLVIAQQPVAEWLRSNLPRDIHVAHYNAISGLDAYKDVRLLILLGRPQPGPEAPEFNAAALSGRMPVSIVGGPNKRFSWYPQVQRSIRVKGSRLGRAVVGDQHPDPFCEAIRWQITEGQLMQAIGRPRGVNRTKKTPLDIDLLFDTVLPIEVDKVTSWERPSLYIVTAAEEGVMLESPIDMVKIWPQLWPNNIAADRTVKGGLPNLPGFTPIIYQLKGPKKKRRAGHFDLTMIPDPRPWLESRLGPLGFLSR